MPDRFTHPADNVPCIGAMEPARALILYLGHMSAHTRYLAARADTIDLLVAWSAIENGQRHVQFPIDEQARLTDQLRDVRQRLLAATTEMGLDEDSVWSEVVSDATILVRQEVAANS